MGYVADLDKDTNLVIVFTVNGTRYAYTKATLIEALGLKQKTELRNQASVSKAISWLLADINDGKLTSQRQTRERLTSILDSFDGNVSKHHSRIGLLLGQICGTEAGYTCHNAMLDFLSRYPSLAPSEAECKIIQAFDRVDRIKGIETDDDPSLQIIHVEENEE